MQRWHSLLDIISFPLKVLFFATILMGFGGLLLNPNLRTIFVIESQLIISFAELLRYFGSVTISYFPLLVMIKALSKRFSESVPVFVGILAYFVFNITTIFFSKANLPASAYSSVLGLQVNLSQLAVEGSGIKMPLHTGFIAAIIVILITRFSYRSSRRASTYGILSFIDKDMWSVIYTIILSIVSGIMISYVWPLIISAFTFIFGFIASDITNPMSLFVYGITDRFLAGLSLSQLIRVPFWFGIQGGSWISPTGVSYFGDVSIWTQQVAIGMIPRGFGRLITPYYILNLFAIPAFVMATFQTFTDKFERRRYRGFIVIAVMISVIIGMLFPFEMFLLFFAPVIYIVHIFFTGVLFATFEAFGVSLGYTFTGLDAVGTPASIVDLLIFVRNPGMQSTMVLILIVGIMTFVFYFLLSRIYFNYLAYDMMNTGKTQKTIEELLTVFGGIDNIRMVHSSLYRVTILPIKKAKVDFSLSDLEGVTKIIEGKTGYSLTYGSGSYIIRTAMIKKIKEHQKQLLEAKKLKSQIEDV